ncbi:hypothetical protein ACKGJO_06845 [Gracilimonas sp. Q87]|uniref:hypothetical protein n=1 Tax=Gracilimonas sp. Q87 TaxID=3384766 RepID=UPI003983FF6E
MNYHPVTEAVYELLKEDERFKEKKIAGVDALIDEKKQLTPIIKIPIFTVKKETQ